VTHITLSKKTSSKPCLEFYSDGSGEARRITIEQFPFRIGRAEAANLRVESAQVSREHAEIFERNGVCLVRDLGSTNGTHVNGKSVKETLLADGDILRVAETELTFIASATSQFQRMVTQPILSKKSPSATCGLPPEIAGARMIAEATLWQVFSTQLLAARSLRHDVTEAYFSPLASNEKQHAFDQSGVLVDRYRELQRRNALESAVEQDEANNLFVAVSPAEIESPHRLFDSLKQLKDLLPGDWYLGITISLPTDVDILRISEVYRQARDLQLLVAFDEFQGNGGQVMHLKSLLPDYLVLSTNMTKDLASSRQPLRRLESLQAACEELAIKPVLPRNDSGHELALCQEIGFDLALLPTKCKIPTPLAELSITV
jgi:EAL domain-containing protein (putative c-di-GMP-specific phosphodiesterase class I)